MNLLRYKHIKLIFLLLMSYREDDILVDSSFLGSEPHLEEYIPDKTRKKKRKLISHSDSSQYRNDNQDSMFSPELQAQIELAKGRPSSTSRQDSKPAKSQFSPELDSQLNQLESGAQKQRFDSFSLNWAELGYGSQLEAEMAYFQMQDEKQRKDDSSSITARRQRRDINGSLSPVEASRTDSEDEHLSPAERISKKRVQRGKQRVSIGAKYTDFN